MPETTPAPASRPAISVRVAPNPLVTAVALMLAIAGLYLGRDIFVSFALAILLGFMIAPLATRLRRAGLPWAAAVMVSVTFALLVLLGIALVVGNELYVLATNIPDYYQTIRGKLSILRDEAVGGGVFHRLSDMFGLLASELWSGQDPVEGAIAIAIRQPPPQPLDIVKGIARPTIAFLFTAGLVVVFVVFILLDREDLRDRFIRLLGIGRVQRSTRALDEAAQLVSRYLLMQLLVNVTYGIPLGIGLFLIGVPNPLLWGVLAAILRFIPYLGPVLAAVFPIMLAFAIDPGWTMLAWTVALILVLEIISNNAVEPLLYGRSTGISSLAIIMAAIFWSTLWGPIGLFLSTPLTVCIVVIGRYMPQFEFLGILLGSDPVLAPDQRFYQRLVAGHHEEALEVAEEFLGGDRAGDFYEALVLPALQMAENDHGYRPGDPDLRREIAERVEHVLADLEELHPAAETAVDAGTGQSPPIGAVCLAGRTPLDAVAARLLARRMGEAGIPATVVPFFELRAGPSALGAPVDGDVIALCYVHAHPQTYARYLARRLRRLVPGARLLVVAFNGGNGGGNGAAGLEPAPAGTPIDAAVHSLRGAVRQVVAWAGEPRPQAASAAMAVGNAANSSMVASADSSANGTRA